MSDDAHCARFPLLLPLIGGAGECRITTLHDHRGALQRLVIDRADPRASITPVMLETIAEDAASPFLSLSQGPRASAGSWIGWLLTIRGENQTAVYRISEYDSDSNCYAMEWPD